MRIKTILKIAFTLSLTAALVQGQVPDIAGEWRVVRDPPATPPSSPVEDWLQALPGGVFTLIHSVFPPLAMVRKDLGYTYFPSQPTISVSTRTAFHRDGFSGIGFLQQNAWKKFEGELAVGGCWIHLSLVESDDGSTLSGSARINTKISTRQCKSGLAKEVKQGAPFKYTLRRLSD